MERGELFAALDGLPWPSFAVTLDQEVVYWSPGLREALGYSGLAVLGRFCWQLGSGLGSSGLTADCAEGCPVYRAARAGLVPSSMDLDMRTAWGEWRRVGVVPLALGHLGWIDRLLVYVVVSVRQGRVSEGGVGQLWSGLPVSPEDVYLTVREREVMELVARGWRNGSIAAELGIKVNTVRAHVANVRVKLGVTNRMEAVMVALRMGLIDLD